MSNRRKIERKVDVLAEELGRRRGVSPRVAAIEALEEALDREWAGLEALSVPKGADDVREGEVQVVAAGLWEEIGPFEVRTLVRFMWGEDCRVNGRRVVHDAVTKVLRANGWVRKRRRLGGVIRYVWLQG